MKGTKRKLRRLLWGCLLGAAALALFFGMCEGLRRLTQYGSSATIQTPSEPETPEEVTQPEEDALIEGLPLNTHDAASFAEKGGFVVYTGPEKWNTGVDVSSHQGEIDWEKAAADGVQFAIIRLGYRGYTEGEVSLDEYFLRNMDDAKAAGLDVGVYFFSQALNEEEAVEEAEFVLSWLAEYALEYPVYFDWEDIQASARTDTMDMLTLTTCADAFCRTVEAGGYRAGVYFNQRFGYEILNLLSLRDYRFWLAEYNPAPSFTYDFALWQYSCEGRVDGISTPVDLNISFEVP